MTDTSNRPAGVPRDHATEPSTSDGLSVLDVLEALGKGKLIFFAILVVGTLAGVLAALLMPKTYTASTIVLPPQQQGSPAGALAQLGALAGVAGLTQSIKSPDEMYVAFLKTRQIQNAVIRQLGLMDRYGAETQDAARSRLADKVLINADKKSGLIYVTAEDQDPQFAARLANLHVDELKGMLSKLTITEAQQRRRFFEDQLGKARQALANAEQVFKSEQARTGFVVTQALAESGIKASIALRADIANREVQLSALNKFATQQNPDVKRLLAELSALRAQLDQMEGGAGKENPLAANGSKAVLAFRDMKVQEAALEALMRQFEIARMDEAQEGPQVQQIDVATAPEIANGPRKLLVVGGAVLASLFVGFFAAIAYALLKDNAASNRERWRAVGHAWTASPRA